MNESAMRRYLHTAGLKSTRPRLALLAALSQSAARPMSAPELTSSISQFPRSTIYRTLQTLERSGLIKSSLIKWVRRYELGDELLPHHHHITCLACAAVTDFDSAVLEQQLVSAADRAGYRLSAHTVELRGLCRACRHSLPANFA